MGRKESGSSESKKDVNDGGTPFRPQEQNGKVNGAIVKNDGLITMNYNLRKFLLTVITTEDCRGIDYVTDYRRCG